MVAETKGISQGNSVLGGLLQQTVVSVVEDTKICGIDSLCCKEGSL